MVAIIGGAIAGGGSLIGGLIGSNAASNATKAQQEMLDKQLQYQLALLNNYDPQLRELQQQGLTRVDNTRGQGLNALTDYTKLAQGTLQGYGQNANDLLRYYFPEAQGNVIRYNDTAMRYLDTAATAAQRNANPYMQAGAGAAGTLGSELASGALGAMPSLTDFSQLPGYQFTLGQGQQAARNAASASGYGGASGPLGKALINYSEGLANTFGSQYLQNYWANQNNRYNILSGTAGMGASAAGNLNQILANIAGNQGSISAGTGATLGGLSSGLGTALAGLQTGLGTGISNLQSGAGSNIANYLTGNANQYLSALSDPIKMLIGLATNTGANFNSAISNASQGIASSIQNQGNLLGSGIAGGLNSGMSNYLLYNALNRGAPSPAGYTAGGSYTSPYSGNSYDAGLSRFIGLS